MPGYLSVPVDRDTSLREASGRNTLIDVARGIAIVLVVLGHNRALGMAWPSMVAAIFLFHVPLFFLLSGQVLRPEHPLRAAPRLARRLLLPFAIAAVLVGAIKCVTRGEPPLETLSGIAWATGQTLPWSHLWFLPSLFLALLTTHALALGLRDNAVRWAIAALIAAIVSAVLPMVDGSLAGTQFPSPVGWPWSIDLLPLCLLFVWLGQSLRGSAAAQRASLHPAVVLIAAAVFVVSLGTAQVDLNMREFSPFALALGAAIAGCVITLKVSQWLCRFALVARPLALIGRHTLVIFILHVSLQKALLAAYPGSLQSEVTLGIVGLVSSAVTIAITLLVSIGIDRLRARRAFTQAGVAPSVAR